MSSILLAKHVSFEYSVSSPRPVITLRREKTTTTRPKFFRTKSTVSPLHAPSSARTCCLHALSELGRGAASFLATESTGTFLIPRLMTRIVGHGPPLWSTAWAGQLIPCLSAQFAPAVARGPSGPAYRCLAAPHSSRPERASLSLTLAILLAMSIPEHVKLDMLLSLLDHFLKQSSGRISG